MFTHLHVHSHYSLLDGLAKIDDLIEAAKEYKMKAMALTDHGVMYGAIEFYSKVKEAGIKPIIGVEAYLARHGHLQKRPKIDEKPYHLILLAKNDQGYKNLIKLTTLAHLQGFYYKPRIDYEILEKYSSDLIALTSCCQGEIPQLIIDGQLEKAEKTILKYNELFGQGNFYLEVQSHPGIKEQILVNKTLLELSKKHNIPVVATNDVHYVKSEDAEIQDILLCLQTKKKKQDKDRLCMLSDDFSFCSPEKIAESFKDYPEVISNTEKIAQMCNLEIELGKIKLPYFSLPENKTADQYLRELCEKKISLRYTKKNKEILNRLENELSVITKTGFASYFLIVQDFVNWAKDNGIVVGTGRGSAAGSIVSYILNITNLDPLKYGLLFERFLTDSRVAPPDIDLDFADTRRNEVIHYVEDKYGRDHVAQIITFGTMAARAAVRDVGRVLDYPYTFCDKLAKMIPFNKSLKQALNLSKDLKMIYESNSDARKIIDMAEKLEGVARHASKHACGVVIAPEPLVQYVPTQYDVSGQEKTIITQYEMNAVEKLGLLKMDFLGLKNLTVIEAALKIIKYNHQKDVNIDQIPLDDKKTFSLLKKAETTGVFQLESEGMRRYLKQLKPTELEDIIIMVALYRPGPIELIPEYIAGKHGHKTPYYLHQKLKPILEKTYGVAVFQEQLLQIVRDLAGFSLSEADILRKAVGKKIPKLLKEQKTKFISGCIKNKISKQTAEQIFAFIEPFAGYGFNLAHATCYAMIAYQTAYLKANYPTEFMAALLTSDLDDIDRIAIEVEETKKMNIEVLPPDINESYKNFTVINQKNIRFGLLAIKNVGENIVNNIIEEREENGKYQTMEDFLTRVHSKDLNKKSLESLIKSGAMDQLEERNQLLQNVETLLEFSRKKQRDRENGQTTIFGILTLGSKLSLKLKKYPPAEHQQKLIWEKELVGLFISDHPLKQYDAILKKYAQPIGQFKTSSRYEENSGMEINYQTEKTPNSPIKVIGLITKIKKIITAGKEAMLFVKIEDPTGEIEVIVFPKIFKSTPDLWQENKIVRVYGRLSDKDGVLKIIAEQVKEVPKDVLDDLLLKA